MEQQSPQELVWFRGWLGLKRWHRAAEHAPVLQLSLLAGVLPVGACVPRLPNIVLTQVCVPASRAVEGTLLSDSQIFCGVSVLTLGGPLQTHRYLEQGKEELLL